MVYPVSRSEERGFSGECPDGHFGELLLYGAKAGYGRLELLTGLCIFNTCLHGQLSPAHSSRAKFQPAYVEDIECDNVPLAYLAKKVLLRYHTVLKKELPRARSLDA